MDADYYFAGGLRLVDGHGFSEVILWNYLDDPIGLPHPSHGYWMPLASLLASFGMMITGNHDFIGSKFGFIFIAALIPPLTAQISYSLTSRKENAIFAGLLAAFPVFYLAYMGTTDTFGLNMLFGALWFLVMGGLIQQQKKVSWSTIRSLSVYYILGVISGLMHLARADGLIWLFLAWLVASLLNYDREQGLSSIRYIIFSMIVIFLGYLLIMGPWMLRNINVFDTPLSPGGMRVLWLTEYNDLYSYPGSHLTFQRWWASGITNILRSSLNALVQNLQTSLAVQGEIILAPLIILGMWRLRDDLRIRLGFLAWVLILFLMTLIFIEVGWRGSFFHSAAALQPLFWAIVPVGLEEFVRWGKRVRNWDPKRAGKVFRIGIISMIILLTVIVVWGRVIGDLTNPVWGRTADIYTRSERALQAEGAGPEDIVLVNNAPGYYVVNRRPALSIPNGNVQTTIEVARRYGGRYLLLEKNHPKGLDELYEHPVDLPGLDFLRTIDNNVHLFQVRP